MYAAPRRPPHITGGRYPAMLGVLTTAPLMTTGAESDQPRETQINYFHDGSDVIVIASNYGGPKHPQWYFNLKAHPECELGDERFSSTEVTQRPVAVPWVSRALFVAHALVAATAARHG